MLTRMPLPLSNKCPNCGSFLHLIGRAESTNFKKVLVSCVNPDCLSSFYLKPEELTFQEEGVEEKDKEWREAKSPPGVTSKPCERCSSIMLWLPKLKIWRCPRCKFIRPADVGTEPSQGEKKG